MHRPHSKKSGTRLMIFSAPPRSAHCCRGMRIHRTRVGFWTSSSCVGSPEIARSLTHRSDLRWQPLTRRQMPWHASKLLSRTKSPVLRLIRNCWNLPFATSASALPIPRISSPFSRKVTCLHRTPCGASRSRRTRLSIHVYSHGATVNPSSGRSSPRPINKETPNRLRRWTLMLGSQRWQRYRMLRSPKKAAGHTPTTSTGL